MGSISIRAHIRWGIDAPSEPTSTLVLTSPGRRFVDIRVLTCTSSESFTARGAAKDPAHADSLILSMDQLDWAFAGTSESSSAQATHNLNGSGSHISHSVFHHWIDSRTTMPEGIRDEGDMIPQSDGMTLETGRMINPATGLDTDYEELWKDLDAEPEPEPLAVGADAGDKVTRTCLVFHLHDDSNEKRGMFVRLGQYGQGVLRIGDTFTAERWMWDKAEFKWKRLFKIGHVDAPSLEALIGQDGSSEKQYQPGDRVGASGGIWTVLEASGK